MTKSETDHLHLRLPYSKFWGTCSPCSPVILFYAHVCAFLQVCNYKDLCISFVAKFYYSTPVVVESCATFQMHAGLPKIAVTTGDCNNAGFSTTVGAQASKPCSQQGRFFLFLTGIFRVCHFTV